MTILCTIDLLTREVFLPADQCIASYDHKVDVIRFQVETIPGFSLDTSSIKIAAQGPNKARHDYAVDPSTVQIEEETGYITFDWPIPAGVTEMPIGTFKYGDRGQLIFAVCAEIIDGSTVSKAWHSDDGIITVVAHLEPESGGGEDPSEEATNAQKIAQLQTDVAVINTQVGALANGSPTPVATVAEMTNESAVYLYTGSETGYTAGNWYYYNGTAWISGGVYGGAVTSTTFDKPGVPADDFAVGQALAKKADADDVNERLLATETELKSTLDDIADNPNVMDYGDSTLTTGLIVNIITGEVTSGQANVKDIIFPVTAGTTYTMLLPAVNRAGMVCNSEKQFSVGNEYTRIAANTGYSNMAIFTVPDGNEYVLFHFYTGADFSGSVTDFKLYKGQYAETQKNITLKDDAIPLASVTSKKQGLSPIAYLFEDIYKLQNQNLTWNTGVSILLDGSVGSAGVATDNASDNVDVSAYDMVYIKASAGYTRLLYAFYDSNSNFVLGKNSISTGYENFAEYVKVPITAKYLKVAQSTSAGRLAGALSFVTGIYDKPWKNKKWVCIGDSLTQVNSTSTKRYYEYVQDVTGIQVANFGVGGTGYANPNGTAGNFVDRMTNVPTDADVYTIFGSFNDVDYGRTNNIEIGTASDSGTTTMCGYFNAAIDALLARVPLANVGVVAPCPWQYCYPAGTGVNSTYGKAYVDALEEVCKRRSIPFLNLFNFSGMRPWVSDFRTLVYTDDPAGGVHPNAIGHEILSTKFKQFLEYLLI